MAWTYSPTGGVILGETGPVTHLDCGNGSIYDWSTGLIFKGGRYFDPNTGIWITMGVVVIWQVRPRENRQQRRGRGKKRKRKGIYLLFILLLLAVALAGCNPPPSPPCPTPTSGIPTSPPSLPPTDAPVPPTDIPPPSPPTPRPPTETPHPPTETPLPPTPRPQPPLPPTIPPRVTANFQEWEKQLLTLTAYFETEGQGLVQTETVTWIILNRWADTTRFPPQPGHETRLEGLIFRTNQFQIVPGIFRHWTEQGIMGENRATLAYNFYTTDSDYNGQEIKQAKDITDRTVTSYNSGQVDPTRGAVYYMHTEPGTEESRIAGLRAVAENEGRLNELTTGFVPGTSIWSPKALVYNNLYSPPFPLR